MDPATTQPHTQIVTPGTTETSHHRLRIAATVCWKLFERCTKVSPSHLGRNYGKFKVWCGNLGVRQGGHASLDWRLKDDDIMENEVFSMLTDLEDDLQQVLEVLSGTRPPYEQEEVGSETSSLNDSLLPGELESRLDAIGATITALYQMSFIVRNQGTRRLASAKAQNYLPRDPEAAALLESFVSFDRQHIDDLFRDLRRPRSDNGQPMTARSNLRNDGDSQDRAIKARCLAASTARRRQLAYWKMHSSKLKSIAAMPDIADPDHNATIYSGTEASGVFKRIEYDFAPAEVQSLASVASTVRDVDGNETEFPGPPERSSDDDPFECPYCFVLCQPEEAGRRRWKKHILEDLRPYICTYPDCKDGTQLHGNRREWTAHEDNAHRSPMISDIDTLKKHVITDDRTQCPICLLDVADLSGRTNLTKHLASHLERFSLDCLPLSARFSGNENLRDDESDSSDPDQGLAPEPHEQTVPNEQDATTVNLEAKQRPEDGDLSIEGTEQFKAIAQETNFVREMIDTEGKGAAEIYKRTFSEIEEELEADELHSMGKEASYSNKSKEEMLPWDYRITRSLKTLAEVETQDRALREIKLELEKIRKERKQFLEEYDRKQDKTKEEAGEVRPSNLEHPTHETINAEYKRVAEDHEREQRKAEDEAGEEELSTLDPSKLESIAASMRELIVDRERTQQHQSKEQAGLLRRLERYQNKDVYQGTEQDKMDDAMRKRLAEADFTPSQIDAIMRRANGRKQQPAPADAPTSSSRAPVYPKVHTDHMAIETLKYYDIPWEYDQSDPSYIIILRELDERETNVLFDFTKRFRSNTILLEDPGGRVIREGDIPFPLEKVKSRDLPDAER